MRFEELNELGTLPNNEVLRLYQESNGYIWIATTGGLYSYNGYEIKEYKSNIKHPNLLPSNKVTALYEDRKNAKLYIGTSNGLAIFDRKRGEIVCSQAQLFHSNAIVDIAQLDDDRFIIGAERGVYIYTPSSDKCERLKFFKQKINIVKSLIKDSQGQVWIGTWNSGMFRYDPKGDKCYIYPRLNIQNSAHVIYEDSSNRIWVGTFGYGLTLINDPYDMEHVSYTTFTANKSANKIADDYVYSISESTQTGALWVGTRKGLSVIPLKSKKSGTSEIDFENHWITITADGSRYTIPNGDIDAIINDKQGNIWIGSNGGGVRCLKIGGHHAIKSVTPNVLEVSPTTRSIFVDQDQNVWSGVGSTGILLDKRYNPSKQERMRHTFNFNGIHNQKTKDEYFVRVNDIIQSPSTDKIWYATSSGIYVYDSKEAKSDSPRSPFLMRPLLYGITINELLYDAAGGGVWAVGYRGLYYIDEKSLEESNVFVGNNINFTSICQSSISTIYVGSQHNGITRFRLDHNDRLKIAQKKEFNTENQNLPCDIVNTLFIDSQRRIWAGTNGASLCLYEGKGDKFSSINEVNNFPTDVAMSITEDSEGILWVGSNIGLIKVFPSIHLSSYIFKLYTESNGLPDNIFIPRAVTKDRNGIIYFGTHKGYIFFDPKKMVDLNVNGTVYITDLKVNGSSISSLPDDKRLAITPYTAGESAQIEISHEYSNFTFEFSSMSYYNPENVRYAYKLDGYDEEWQYTTASKRFAHYANIPFGTYQFKLRSTSENGMWDKNIREVKVLVTPPNYLSWWAKLIYILFAAGTIFWIYRLIKQRVKLRTSLKIQRLNQEKSEAVNHAKLRFFTNVTHDLFTPITIVAAAIEDHREKFSSKNYEVIIANINRLSRLIQQILEFRKSETGNLHLFVAQQDITKFILNYVESFTPLMKRRKIEITTPQNTPSKMGYIDTDKLDKILYNLLSNALKYNKAGAKVDVELSYPTDRNSVVISIGDNGSGLSEDAMNNLFKRFYDGDFRRHKTSGTGIGLSLVRDLVELHKGTIEVDNQAGRGVKFIVELPIDVDSYAENERYEEEEASENTFSVMPTASTSELLENTDSTDPEADMQYTILIVDDNEDLLMVLRQTLSKSYNVITANDGTKALEIMSNEDIEIDIIVTDVMMEEMNGYELCQEIKGRLELNHIPIILLTAKREQEAAVEGYNAGADSIITKPFSTDVLLSRINNLLSARASRAEQFKNKSVVEIEDMSYTSYDETFLNSTLELIRANFADATFDQNMLADAVGMSKSTLHRKLKSMTGMTASSLIKEMRMKRAHELLCKIGITRISEVAYAVGFNDPKYFTIRFKKRFGYLPSEIPSDTPPNLPPEADEE